MRGHNTTIVKPSSFVSPRKAQSANPDEQRALAFLESCSQLSPLVEQELKEIKRQLVSAEREQQLLRQSSADHNSSLQDLILAQQRWAQAEQADSYPLIDYYCGAGWRKLNNHLRNNQAIDQQEKEYHQAIMELFASAPRNEHPLLVSRAISMDEAEDFYTTPARLKNIYRQDLITDPAYMSTGANLLRSKPIAQQINMLIEIPSGNNVLAVAAFDSWDRDQEILLPPGTTLEVKHRLETEDNLSLFARVSKV